jgi:very-short-patch-repair endonuclease
MRGAKAMRCVVKERLEWNEVTDSELETLFLTLARRYRLFPDQSHIVIYDGKVRVKEVDFVYSGARLAIELDSYKFHGALDPFDADREVDAVLQRLGWRIIRVAWRHLKQNPDRVFNEIRLALGVVPLPNLSR